MSDSEWACSVCNQEMHGSQLLDHMRLLHPDQYEELELSLMDFWPDGNLVVHEDPDDEEWL